MASTQRTLSVRDNVDPHHTVCYPGTINGITNLLTGGGTLSATATAAGDAYDYGIISGTGGANTSTGNGGTGGDITYTGGAGGSVSGAGTSGRGGDFVLIAAAAGAGAGTAAAPGRIFLRGFNGEHFSGDIQTASFGDVNIVYGDAGYAAALRAGYFSHACSGKTITLPSAAQMLILFPTLAVGDIIYFHVSANNGGGASAVVSGSDTDPTNAAARSITNNTAGIFAISFTSTAGAYTLYRVG